jgi:hypothetical protein
LADGSDAPAEAPRLTLPAAEAEAVAEAFAGAAVILEYGSGGSTALAAGMAGKTVFSVESDRRFFRQMRRWFAQNPPLAALHLSWVDVGDTKAWGRPRDEAAWRRYPDYALSVWERRDFVHPDVVLIDGRFRVACLIATALMATRPVTVLFDDYIRRERYRIAEDFAPRTAQIGRMARFAVEPRALNPLDLRKVLTYMHDPA